MPKRDFSRTDRVASEIQRELSFLLQREVKDPRVGLTTIAGVRLSKDLQNANVYVTFLGRDAPEQTREGVDTLNQMSGFLRSLLGQRIRLRVMPKLQFHYDEVQRRSQRLNSLITSAVHSDQARRGAGDESSMLSDDSEE